MIPMNHKKYQNVLPLIFFPLPLLGIRKKRESRVHFGMFCDISLQQYKCADSFLEILKLNPFMTS